MNIKLPSANTVKKAVMAQNKRSAHVELAPCPFCGFSEAEVTLVGDLSEVHCQCGARGPMLDGEKLAAETWNSRARKKAKVILPYELTAENGAKAALIGEFEASRKNPYHCDCGNEGCEACELTEDNWIPETETIPISWTTIKAIWAKAVEHFTSQTDAEIDAQRSKSNS